MGIRAADQLGSGDYRPLSKFAAGIFGRRSPPIAPRLPGFPMRQVCFPDWTGDGLVAEVVDLRHHHNRHANPPKPPTYIIYTREAEKRSYRPPCRIRVYRVKIDAGAAGNGRGASCLGRGGCLIVAGEDVVDSNRQHRLPTATATTTAPGSLATAKPSQCAI